MPAYTDRMDRRTALERLRIVRITGAGHENYHVYYEDFFRGAIYYNSEGWHRSHRDWPLGPFQSSQEAIAEVRAWYAGLDIVPWSEGEVD